MASSIQWSRFGQAVAELPRPGAAPSGPSQWTQLAARQQTILDGLAALKKEMEEFSKSTSAPAKKTTTTSTTTSTTSAAAPKAEKKDKASPKGASTTAGAPAVPSTTNTTTTTTTTTTTSSSSSAPETKAVPLAKIPPPVSMARPPTVLCDAVVHASLANPPAATLAVAFLLHSRASHETVVQHMWHSSAGSPPPGFVAEQRTAAAAQGQSNARISFIWKKAPTSHLIVSSSNSLAVEGDANMARFLARAGGLDLTLPASLADSVKVDEWVDCAGGVQNAKDLKQLLKEANAALGQSSHLVGGQLSLADAAVFGVLRARGGAAGEKNVQRWLSSLASVGGLAQAGEFLEKYVLAK